MAIPASIFRNVPNKPALYVLYAGSNPAYVGISGNLRTRLVQHFVNRDSSVTTKASAVVLNPERITRVEWWVDARFQERASLEAAELVRFDNGKMTRGDNGKVTHPVHSWLW